MKNYKLLVLLFLLPMINSCGKKKIEDSISFVPTAFIGSWITPCMDMGGGAVNQIFSSVSDTGAIKVAVLTHNVVGCTGGYTMTDSNGNPVTEPAHTVDALEKAVLGIPSGFHVLETNTIPVTTPNYVLIYLNGSNFYELVGFTAFHINWSDWLAETDVPGFVASPASFTPTTMQHLPFSKGSLP